MQLDVIIPTYNRQELLKRTLDSLLVAEVPQGLDVSITVVDNNSKDGTRVLVQEYTKLSCGKIQYVFEKRQGRSSALNSGILATSGELVGMIDDDEEIDPRWYFCIQTTFNDQDVHFLGGRCLPRWGAKPPNWLPKHCAGVIGWIDGVEKVSVFGQDYPGMLMGGNAVIRRTVLQKVGLYATELGRTDKGLLSYEDRDMYDRLMAVGARGLYVPELVVHHYIPPERLTKTYYRRWFFWSGVSYAVRDARCHEPVVYLGKVPRFLYGQAARGLFEIIKAIVVRESDPSTLFSHQLPTWFLAGVIYGKHFYSTKRQPPCSPQA